MPGQITDALADIALLGPFFAVSTDPAEEADPLWRPFPGGVRPLVEMTAARMGAVEPRVAASTAQLGLASRLWSPVVGCALAHGVVPGLAALRHRAGAPGVVPLWLSDLRGEQVQSVQETAAAVYRSVVEDQLHGINAAIREASGVADGLLWGNAAAALIGSLRVLTSARPALAGPGRDLAVRLLGTGRLRGTMTPALRRRSCCLYYRAPNGGLCGDCCFDKPPISA